MQVKRLFNPDKGDIQEVAKSLSEAYDLSALLSLLPNDSMCANGCGSKGVKRCSRCKAEWYCGRFTLDLRLAPYLVFTYYVSKRIGKLNVG
ncbi:hypothetical protein J437_LFUL018995 [Ladona fulva]|uniref:Uncharacterized protein n=1 Tax=Ladona fulva TaxID=123851 RepID=A0A8K0KQ41_LADFU|nr:hypothetical protein J437_LFUL018995 [Ladona fulva]